MHLKTPASVPRGGKSLVIAIISLTSFIISALILRHGVGAGPDPWTYWASSVNLIERHKFTDMLGEQITMYPPFFSIFLIPFQLALSQTGWGLDLAMCTISALVAAVWSVYVYKVFATDESPLKSVAFTGSLLFVPIFASLCCSHLMAHALLLVWLGILFNYIASIADRPDQWISFFKPVFTGLLLAACMLTHNSSIIFVVSVVLVVLVAAGGSLPQRMLAGAAILLISLTPWLIVRHLLAQERNYDLIIGKGIITFIEKVVHVPMGIGTFYMPIGSPIIRGASGAIIILAALILWIRKPQSDAAKRHRVLIGFGLAALAGHLLLFTYLRMESFIEGRFTWFFVMMITPVFFFLANKRMGLVVVFLLLTVGVSGWRVTKAIWYGEVPALTAHAGEEDPNYIYAPFFLTSRADANIPRGAIQVRAPIYSWQKVPPELQYQVEKNPAVKLIKAGPGVTGSPF